MAKAVSSARTARAKKTNGNGSGAENEQNTPQSTKRNTGNLEEMIRQRAYELFQQDGFQHGRDQEHWLRAEAELRGKSA
ncbi:MAG: DUF2934 domain-containing protein [Acidobacteriaceae bacterium]|nr:DUF2934 domain-containing protein [Acidobacteriaceae bacterium]